VSVAPRFGVAAITLIAALAACDGGTATVAAAPYPHATEPIGTVRQSYDGVLTPELAVNTFRTIDRLFPTRAIHPSAAPRPLLPAAQALGS
jgi:hypothetical protein